MQLVYSNAMLIPWEKMMADQRGWWELTLSPNDLELSEVDQEHIGELIKEGYTSGEVVEDEDENNEE